MDVSLHLPRLRGRSRAQRSGRGPSANLDSLTGPLPASPASGEGKNYLASSLQASTADPQYSAHLARSSGPLPTTLASRKSTIRFISLSASVSGGSGMVNWRERRSAVLRPKQRPSL